MSLTQGGIPECIRPSLTSYCEAGVPGITTKIFWDASSSYLVKSCLWKLSSDVASDQGDSPLCLAESLLVQWGLPPLAADRRLPLSLLKTAQNHPMLVELKNGETYNGHLVSCDNWMNINLREVICTSRDGDKFWRMPECYIRGSTIKYLRIPDEIIDMVKEEVVAKGRGRGGLQQQKQQKGRGMGGAGRGVFGGRGRGGIPGTGRGQPEKKPGRQTGKQ
ncbi:U6 snRNA-associated Sm-like protein LSm4 isoform X1 [Desmodus rotundus]|nr:U6 snRNA-associated Sm-like protein LSm4 isoform X1 [Desmodus rotundus]